MSNRVFLGTGIQRKQQDRPELVLSWCRYRGTRRSPELCFGGMECKSLKQVCSELSKNTQEQSWWFCFYDPRGEGYYLPRSYGPLPIAGHLIEYDAEAQDDIDPTATRLAADVARLRDVERDWPSEALTSDKADLRRLIRTTEFDVESGRGPLKRLLARVSAIQTDYVPTAAMAFQACRRCWSEYGAGWEDVEEELGLMGVMIGRSIVMPAEKTEGDQTSLIDPAWAFAEESGEFEDIEAHLD